MPDAAVLVSRDVSSRAARIELLEQIVADAWELHEQAQHVRGTTGQCHTFASATPVGDVATITRHATTSTERQSTTMTSTERQSTTMTFGQMILDNLGVCFLAVAGIILGVGILADLIASAFTDHWDPVEVDRDEIVDGGDQS